MNNILKHLDVDDVIEIIRKYGDIEKHDVNSLNKLYIVSSKLDNLEINWKSLYTTVDSYPGRKSIDYVFDVLDSEGKRILPFTSEKPLYVIVSYYSDILSMFPELNSAASMKAGCIKNDLRDKIIKRVNDGPYIEYYEKYYLGYMGGMIQRHDHTQETNRIALKEELFDYMGFSCTSLMDL